MSIKIKIQSQSGNVQQENIHSNHACLVYEQEYKPGDCIQLEVPAPGFYLVQLDDTMGSNLLYFQKESLSFPIPFEEQKNSYNPKSFAGSLHVIEVRAARKHEIECYRNLALNAYDFHENKTCFPHAAANVETRGESVFAARNAINGNCVNHSHGNWPYESWGINQDPEAELTLFFGRMVEIDQLILTTRADFPHDNWWKEVTVTFSDHTELSFTMQQSSDPHAFAIGKRQVEWIRLSRLRKEESNPSPFPALTQIEVFGKEV